MQFSPNPLTQSVLYDGRLKTIKGISFTPREIDVIACIVHNRSEKKIAHILSLSPKTVSTHVRNIMLKLGRNSKDSIIDFIEKSGELKSIRQYYYCLVVQNMFIEYLKQISRVIKTDEIICFLPSKEFCSQNRLLITLLECLEFAKIKHQHSTHDNSELQRAQIDIQVNVKINKSSFSPETGINYSQGGKQLLLIFDREEFDKSDLTQIDFSSGRDFYESVIELCETIIQDSKIKNIGKRFKDDYELFQQTWEGSEGIVAKKRENDASLLKSIVGQYTVVLTLLIGILIIGIIVSIYWRGSTDKSSTVDISKVNEAFAAFAKEFSADSLTSNEKKQKNYQLYREVEGVVGLLDNEEVYVYYTNNPLLSDTELMNSLYVLQALSNHFTYNRHDGKHARDSLLKALKIAESFVSNKNNLEINFAKLSPEEILAELKIVKDLPEMYTKIIYMLARTYIYDGNLQESVKFFKLAVFLGEKLGLFEAFMSRSNGLASVLNADIEEHIERHQYDSARNKLLKVIDIIYSCLTENKVYTMNFRPGDENKETIIPKNDELNIIFCREKLIKHYSRLVKISSNIDEKREGLKKIYQLLFSSDSSEQLLEMVNRVNKKTSAYVHNAIGGMILRLQGDDSEHVQNIKRELCVALKIPIESDELEIAEQLFYVARKISRASDFTKADSYDGLIIVYTKMLEQENMNDERQLRLKISIKELTAKRDKLNKELHRLDWQLRQNRI